MFSIVELLIVIAILLIGLAFYSIIKQKMSLDNYSSEFKGVMEEAKLIKEDLKILMENAIEISSTIVDGVDNKLNNNLSVQNFHINKVDLFNLSEQYGLTIEQMFNLLDTLGYNTENFREDIVDKESKLIEPKDTEFYPKPYESSVLKVLKETDNNLADEKNKENDIFQEVVSLANQGYSVKEMAKLLNRGQGEISLLLNLFKKSQAI